MRLMLKRLTRMVLGYGAVQWAGPLLSLIFTPILTRILNPSDYGIAEYVLTIASAVSTLALLGLPQALTTHFNDRPDDRSWQRNVTGSALALVVSIGVPVSLTLLILAPELARLGLGDTSYSLLFRLIGGSMLFGMVGAILSTAAQAALRVRWGMLFSVTSLIATALGNILFILLLRLGVTGMVLVPVVSGLALCAVSTAVVRPLIGQPNPSMVTLLLQSGLLLLPSVAAAWMLQVVDRLFLIHYVSTEALGHYAIANRIAGLLYVAMGPIYAAWTPLALSIQHELAARERYASMARYLMAAALLAALALGLFATEILIVLTRPAYLPAAPYVGFLTYVYVLAAVGTVLSTGALAGKQLKELSGAIFAGALINIALNFTLIPRFGVWGATVATVIGYAVPQVILYLILQRRYPIPYPTTTSTGRDIGTGRLDGDWSIRAAAAFSSARGIKVSDLFHAAAGVSGARHHHPV